MKLPEIIFCTVILVLSGCRAKTEIESSIVNYPADSKSSGVVRCHLADEKVLVNGPLGDTASIRLIARERSGLTENIYISSTTAAGKVSFETSDGVKLGLTFYKILGDIDGDGFPDAAELSDEKERQAFVEWFVRIAESQFLKRNYSWNTKERDCAGLIRYAYREAMKRHDEKWQQKSGILIDKNIPDLTRFSYPNVPVIGERLFKIKSGPADDIKTFSTFADAATILSHNVFLVSRNISDARKGDLLFFHLDSADSPYHSMIFTGGVKGSEMLVYHTGKGDVVKRVPLLYLDSSSFEPSEKNRRFLGVYRFNILE